MARSKAPAPEKGHATVATLATLLDLDVRRVQQLAKAGVIPRAKRGSYPIAESVRGYIRYLRRTETDRVRPGDFEGARTRKMSAEAEMAEIELATRRGQMVAVQDVVSRVASVLERVRARITAIPGKLAPRLVGAETAMQAQGLLQDAVGEVLTELAEGSGT